MSCHCDADGECVEIEDAAHKAHLAERAAVVAFIREWVKSYSPDVFEEPPPGKHGRTVDACSTRALRVVIPKIADAIERGEHVKGKR